MIVIIDVKAYGGFTADELVDFAKPKGTWAYSRAALLIAILALESSVEEADIKVNGMKIGKRFSPALFLQCPCPALVNARHKPASTIEVGSADSAEAIRSGDIFTYFEEHGQATHGDIYISDALADTYLYLNCARDYFMKYVDNGAAFKVANIKKLAKGLPGGVLTEATGLLDAWTHWQPGKRLDFSRSPTLPPIAADCEPEQLLELVAERDSTLVALLFIALAHEYGHLLRARAPEARRAMDHDAQNILDALMSGGLVREFGLPFGDSVGLLQRNQAVLEAWREEISCDFFALNFCEHFLPDDTFHAMATLCLLLALVETFNIRKYGSAGMLHPVSSVRLTLNNIYLSSAFGYRAGWRWTVDAVGRIGALQSRLLSTGR